MIRTLSALLLAAAAANPALAGGPVFSASASWEKSPPAAGSSATLLVAVTVQPGWHVNSNHPLDEFLIPTSVSLDLPAGWTSAQPVFPPHKLARFAFSDGELAVFEGTIVVSVVVTRGPTAPAVASLGGKVEAQACNDKLCLAPTEVPFTVAAGGEPGGAVAGSTTPAATSERPAPAEGSTPASGLSARFLAGSLPLQLLLVFLAGLALNLTPCVYPLIPITVGFFAAQKQTSRAGAAWLALAYLLGMSVTYSALGVAAALTGRLFGAALQSPIVVGVVVAVLLALAASMFGAWELRVPGWATRLSGGRSGAGGALLMGLMVGFVAAPCIGPFVVGLLTYVGQRQDVVLGFTFFFVLSLGLGLPYLVLALSTKALERLPNSGAWMIGVRLVFGVLLVGLAAYFVKPLLPVPWGEWLLAAVLVVGGLYLLVVARPGHEQAAIDRAMRLASAAILLAGVILAPTHREKGEGALPWSPYNEAAVTKALAADRPVVIDFFATWCVPCKELDEKTFSSPEVRPLLAELSRFKVDLTAENSANEELRRHFGVVGVPTIVFFRGGKEVEGTRLTGFEPPEAFLARLRRVTAR